MKTLGFSTCESNLEHLRFRRGDYCMYRGIENDIKKENICGLELGMVGSNFGVKKSIIK